MARKNLFVLVYCAMNHMQLFANQNRRNDLHLGRFAPAIRSQHRYRSYKWYVMQIMSCINACLLLDEIELILAVDALHNSFWTILNKVSL